jgi:hypothetical protein
MQREQKKQVLDGTTATKVITLHTSLVLPMCVVLLIVFLYFVKYSHWTYHNI